jgi:hypothetical protein
MCAVGLQEEAMLALITKSSGTSRLLISVSQVRALVRPPSKALEFIEKFESLPPRLGLYIAFGKQVGTERCSNWGTTGLGLSLSFLVLFILIRSHPFASLGKQVTKANAKI